MHGMGLPVRPLVDARRNPRPLDRLRLSVAALTLAVASSSASPAFAQVDWTKPDAYTDWTKVDAYNQAPVNRPVNRVPTNNFKNITKAAERNMVRRGFAAGPAANTALLLGSLGLAAAYDDSYNLLSYNITGTAAGGLAGCGIGAGIGVWAMGVGAVPGCLAGLWWGMAAGGFAGSAIYNITSDGSVQIDPSKGSNPQGVGVRQVGAKTTTGVAANIGYIYDAGGSSCIVRTLRLNNSSDTPSVIPINNSRTIRNTATVTSSTRYGAIYRFDTAIIKGWTNVNSVGAINLKTMTAIQFNNGCTGSINLPQNGDPWVYVAKQWVAGSGTNTGPTTDGSVLAYVATTNYAAETDVPLIKYDPIVQVPMYQVGFGTTIDQTTLEKDLDPAFVAKLMNYIWARAGTNVPVPYDAANPVTADDVTQAGVRLKMADLVRPVANPEAEGATSTKPVTEPITVANPSTGTPTSSGGTQATKEVADQDLDSLWGGTLGEVTEPIKAAVAGPFGAWLNPVVEVPLAQCPQVSIDLVQLMTGRSGAVADSGQICSFFDQLRPTIVALIHALAPIFFALGLVRRIQ